MEPLIGDTQVEALILKRAVDQGELLRIVILCKSFICFICRDAAKPSNVFSVRLTISVEREYMLICLEYQLTRIKDGAVRVKNHCFYIGSHTYANCTPLEVSQAKQNKTYLFLIVPPR